jgi:asparagine N-glycosylation enzyme membrane subunit Stt3
MDPKDLSLEQMRRFRIPVLLLAIFLVCFSIVYLSHGPRLSDPDAWHYYRYVKWIVEDGVLPSHDELQYYPTGSNPRTDNIVHSYLIAYLYRFLQPLGIGLMGYLMAIEAFLGGGVAAICLYFAVKELVGRRVGLLSSLLYGMAPLMLTRIYAGSIDKEVVYGLFVFTSLYFFLRGYKMGVDFRRGSTLIYPLLSGVFFGLGVASWSGVDYILLALSAAAAIHFLFDQDTSLMKTILIVVLAGSLTRFLLQPYKFPLSYFPNHLQTIVPFAVALSALAIVETRGLLKRRYRREVPLLYVSVLLLFGALGILYLLGQGEWVRSLFTRAIGLLSLGKGVQEDLYMQTVAESQPVQFFGASGSLLQRIQGGELYWNLGLMLYVLPLGILYLAYRLYRDRKEFSYLFMLVWVLSGLLAAAQGKRLLFFLAPSAVAVAAFALLHPLIHYRRKERRLLEAMEGASKKSKAWYEASRGLSNVRLLALAFSVLTLLIVLSTLTTATASMGPRKSDLPPPWYDALLWTEENTPENSVILFWWDYGYYFQAVAERRTVADGGGNVPRNIDLAKMFTSPEEEAMKYIRKYVNYSEVPTYMVVSYEEFGKSGAINRIAGGNPERPGAIEGDGTLYIASFTVPKSGDLARDDQRIGEILQRNQIERYYIVDRGDAYLVWVLIQFDNEGRYHPEWKEKLLVKLLPFNNGLGEGLKHFTLVYPEGGGRGHYVYIYRVHD